MKDQRRGRNIALAGAALQAVFTVTMIVLGTEGSTNAKGAMASAWFLGGGVLVWLMVAVVFYCRQLAAQEEAELAELSARGETAGGLFEDDRDLSLRPAHKRVRFVAKWVVGGFTLVLAGWQVAFAVLVLGALRFLVGQETLPPMGNLEHGVAFSALVALVAFLFSRYCTGMASEPQWRPLRSAASYLAVNAVAVAAVLGGYLFAFWGYRVVDVGVAFAVPIVQLVLAAELLINLVLDFYRPRLPGQERRLAFDSRLFNLFSEPGRLGHSIAETLNYQFGFEVSGTWFFQLLGKALMPLVVLGIAVLFLLTSIVVVYQGQQSVVLHWGRRDEGRLLGPGIHLKWPWPVDTAEHFDVGKVKELRVGVGEQREPIRAKNGREIRLWTQTHGQYMERNFLVAIPPERAASRTTTQAAGRDDRRPPPVNIIKLVLSVRYRIADAYRFGYRFADAESLLEGAAYREMIRYCASATLHEEVGGDPNRPEAIMTSGRGKASAALAERIGKAVGAGGLDLGVEIVAVEVVAVHPPSEVAGDYEAVLAAERGMDGTRYAAEGEANRMLAAVAGDPDSALVLALAIRRLEQLENLSGLRDNAAEFKRHVEGHVRDAGANIKMLRAAIKREALMGKLGAEGARAAGGAPAGPKPSEALRVPAKQLGGSLGELLEDLSRWELLDEVCRAPATPKQRLAALYVRHVLDLLAAGADPAGFDFAAKSAGAREQADALFDRATGKPAQQVAQAQAYRQEREMSERTRAEAFQRELLAYHASPDMYMLDRWLDVWDEILPGMTKYILGVPRDQVELRMDWQRRKSVFGGAFGAAERDE